MPSDFNQPIRGYDLLHPVVRPAFEALGADLKASYKEGTIKTLFLPFETYRYPQRQLVLIQAGTTKAMPYESAHQFGLAVDFVPWVTLDGISQWSWHKDAPWKVMHMMAERHGLKAPISWDQAHVQHPRWDEIRKEIHRFPPPSITKA